MVPDTQENILVYCLRRMLKPAIRFCLRRSLHVQDVIESVKVVFIEAACDELQANGQGVNVSRLAAMTGMHRRDVMRIHKESSISEQPQGLVNRVIGQWQQDPRFTTKYGRPKVLSFEGENSEFQELVKLVSNDLHPGTVLFELERIGAVQKSRSGVRLVVRAYVPKGNAKEGYDMLASDAADLMNAVEENLFEPVHVPNLHAKTEYDNVSVDAIPEIREWLLREGSALHQKARNYLAKYDLDINPAADAGSGGARVVLGTFSLAAELDDKKERGRS